MFCCSACVFLNVKVLLRSLFDFLGHFSFQSYFWKGWLARNGCGEWDGHECLKILCDLWCIPPDLSWYLIRTWDSGCKHHLTHPFNKDIMSSYFKLTPRLRSMVGHAPLADELLSLAKNGILSQVDTTRAISDMVILEPGLLGKCKKPDDIILPLQRGVRTLLTWYRKFKMYSKTRKQVLKGATACDEALLEKIAGKMVLNAKVGEANKGLHPGSPITILAAFGEEFSPSDS